MQQSITQPQKIMKVRHLQQKWMDLEINFVSLAFAQFKLLVMFLPSECPQGFQLWSLP